MIDCYFCFEMVNIWSEENKYCVWFEVEILVDEVWVELGEIFKEDVVLICEKVDFDIDCILEIEQEMCYDVVVFMCVVFEMFGEECKWVYYGLIFIDVVDMVYGYFYKQVNDIICCDFENFINIIVDKVKEYKFIIMMGCIYGVYVEFIIFGLKLVIWYSEMKCNIECFEYAAVGVEVGKIFGVVGNFVNILLFVE